MGTPHCDFAITRVLPFKAFHLRLFLSTSETLQSALAQPVIRPAPNRAMCFKPLGCLKIWPDPPFASGWDAKPQCKMWTPWPQPLCKCLTHSSETLKRFRIVRHSLGPSRQKLTVVLYYFRRLCETTGVFKWRPYDSNQ